MAATASGRRVAGAAVRRYGQPGRVLVAGWFGFVHGEATAGDLLAARTVCGWLGHAGLPYDLALSPVFRHGVRLSDLDPSAYTHAVFVCGPVAGEQVRWWLDRFACCVRIGVGVSVVDSTPAGFDVLIPRDRAGAAADSSPDLAIAADGGPDLLGEGHPELVAEGDPDAVGSPELAADGRLACAGDGRHERAAGDPGGAPPAVDRRPAVLALVRAHRQPEHPGGSHDQLHARIDALLRQRDAAVLTVDTRVDPRELTGRTANQVIALLARADAVVTTRLHGLVLALRQGVPALAVDPVAGGAKVSRQAATLGWPAALTESTFTDDRFNSMLDWCLGSAAAVTARRCAAGARQRVNSQIRERLLAALGPPAPPSPAPPPLAPPILE